MFQSDHSPDLPADSDLLAELGHRPVTPSERSPRTTAHIRCPDRGAVYPERSFANLNPESVSAHTLHEAPPAEPRDPASGLPPAD